MMKKYVTAYALWFLGVLAMAAVAAAWYRYVEDIGVRELASRLRATDATDATDGESRNGDGD